MKLFFNFGILAVDRETKTQVKHICTYEFPPTELDFKELRKELETNQELGLVGEDFILQVAHSSFLRQIEREATGK